MAVACGLDNCAQDARSSHDLKMQQMRLAEFSRFEGSVYADHAGAALYSEAQLEEVMQASQYALLFRKNLFTVAVSPVANHLPSILLQTKRIRALALVWPLRKSEGLSTPI